MLAKFFRRNFGCARQFGCHGAPQRLTPHRVQEDVRQFEKAGPVLKRHQQLAQNSALAVGNKPRWARQQAERQAQQVAREGGKGCFHHGASGMLEQEGERWVISCGGFANAAAPTDIDGFRAYLKQHAPPETAHVAAVATPIGAPVRFRYPASEHRHFERMPRFPSGYVVMGDALCSFNPVYGQGMTVAAGEAVALRQCLQQGADQLAPRFFKAAARLIAAPWEITVGSDLALPMVEGKRPFGFALMNRFMDRVVHTAQTDLRVAKALLAVIHLTAPSWSLLHPAMLWRVWRGEVAR